MAPAEPTPILYLWSLSAWAGKVVAYLALRGIPHARCEQPITMPRPDLAALGVRYRRIPLLSVGRDVYCDTLLILEQLERMYPPGAPYKSISAATGTEVAVEKLFEKWTDLCVFPAAAAAIPTELDLMKDPAFQKDREELWGRSWSAEEQKKLMPAGLANLRANFDLLESILSDGREWVLGGEGPKLADIHACWIFDWLFQLGAFPEPFFSAARYPRTFAWRDRYSAAINAAKEATPNPPTELSGAEAIRATLDAALPGGDLPFHDDPIGLTRGQEVEMFPIDTGYNSRDSGTLIGLTSDEAVVSAVSDEGGKEVRIHYPRWNFTIAPKSGGKASA